MQNLKVQEFRKLLFEAGGPCVSIYMDGVSSVDADSADRLERLIAKAAKTLTDEELHDSPQEFLKPASELLEKNAARLVGRVGVGIFVSPRTQAFVCLPIAPKERLVVADSFHLKPLMKALATGVDTFAVVALTLRGAQLFEGEAGVARLVRDVPLDRRIRLAVEATDEAQDGRALLRQFMRRLDRTVRTWVGRTRRPLILAGPAYLRALYREINTYPYLIHEGFAMDSIVRADVVHARATRVLSTTIERNITQDLSELRDADDDPNVTFDIKTASRWVAMGVVDKIFVAEDASVAASYDLDSGDVRLKEAVGGDCLLDDLAEEVLRNGGRVVCIPQAGFPRRGLVAAIKQNGEAKR